MVKFIEEIKRVTGLSNYGLARLLDVPTQSIDHALDKGKSLSLPTLTKLRYISKLTWNQFGKMLDAEYFTAEDKKRIDSTTVQNRPEQRKRKGE